jgi:methylase of polypeptide subunit release factors
VLAAPLPQAASLLRRTLARTNFDETRLRRLLGGPDPRLTSAEQEALWRWRADRETPLAALARLFLLQQPLTPAAARQAFGDDLEAAHRLRLLRRHSRGIESPLLLTPHAGFVLASDAGGARPDREHVLGPTTATLLTDGLIVRRPIARALDLGTGVGALALGLTRHARQVTAADVSPRALAFARFNAALNGCPAPALVHSDRFASLGRRRFDLIVGNLPFVISPERRFTYRDAGAPADDFLAATIRETGQHLADGGLAQYLGQWAHVGIEPEDDRLAPWFVAAGCDALVLRFESEPIDVYAARWSAGPGTPGAAERQRLLDSWMTYYRRAGIRAISTGLFTLRRRRADRHFFVIDDVDATARPTSADIVSRFAELDRATGRRPGSSPRRRAAGPRAGRGRR